MHPTNMVGVFSGIGYKGLLGFDVLGPIALYEPVTLLDPSVSQ